MSIEEWNEDSILSRAGYTADGSLSQRQRISCINQVIDNRLENALLALDHLRWLVDDRGGRFPNALKIWKEDIGYISRVVNSDSLAGDPETVSSVVADMTFKQVARNSRSRSIFG